MKKQLSTSLFNALISYGKNQINDIIDKLPFLTLVVLTSYHHSKQYYIRLLKGLNYLELRDYFKPAPNESFGNSSQMQPETYLSV